MNSSNRRSSLRLQSKLTSSQQNNNNTSNNDTSLTTATSSDYDADTSSISISNENVNNSSQDKYPMILRSNLLMNNSTSSRDINNSKSKLIKIGKITDKKLRLKTKKNLKNKYTTTSKKKRLIPKKKEKKAAKKCLTVNSSQNETIEISNNNDTNDNDEDENYEQTTDRPTTSNRVVEMLPEPMVLLTNIENPPVHTLSTFELKFQLKKATVKFNKACRQLTLLDQHMSDLQNSYSNAVDNDRKTFKIVFRMQLATLEGTHNAYIEYIERQVERIKKLKQLLFTDSTGISNHLNV
jgi:hypothetical protein